MEHKYFRRNSWTNRFEIAIPRKSFSEQHGRVWEIQETATMPPGAAAAGPPEAVSAQTSGSRIGAAIGADGPAADSLPAAEEPGVDAVTEPESPDDAEAHAGGQADPPAHKKARRGNQLRKEESPSQRLWKDVAASKVKQTAALSAASALLRAVDVDEGWQWITRLEEHEALKTQVADLEAMEKSYPFWQDLRVCCMQQVRRKYGEQPDLVQQEMAARKQCREAKCDSVQALLYTIHAMRAARTSPGAGANTGKKKPARKKKVEAES